MSDLVKRLREEGSFIGNRQPAREAMDEAANEIKRLTTALESIRDSKFCSYDENGTTSYGTGVTDGHRYCSNTAKDAIEGTPI